MAALVGLTCGPRPAPPAPDGGGEGGHALATLSGAPLDLDALIGERPLVLVFWATWCGPCYDEAPQISRLSRRYSPRGVAFVSVSIDDVSEYEGLRAMVAELRLPYPVALDPDQRLLERFLPAGTVPLTLLFDSRGEIVYRAASYEVGDERRLEAALDALTAGGAGH